MKVFEMFSGFGGASFALKKAGIDFECVGFSEIDKFAVQCYNQNHFHETEARTYFSPIDNYGDCTKINPIDLPDFDLLTGGFPCQSFSVAGKGQGEQDTRGTLFNDIIRIAEIKKPKYILLENVKGLTNKRHAATFEKILSELQRIGYQVEWKVLNSKEHGIPQNRERVFFVCWQFGKMNFIEFMEFCQFKFPKKEELKIFLKDILEDFEVPQEWRDNLIEYEKHNRNEMFDDDRTYGEMIDDEKAQIEFREKEFEKYHLSEAVVKKLISTDRMKEVLRDKIGICQTSSSWRGPGNRGCTLIQINNPKHSNNRIYSPEGVSPTLRDMSQGGNRQPFILASRGRNPSKPGDRTKGIKTEQRLEPRFDGASNTITSVQKDNYVGEPVIIQRQRGFNKGGLKTECPTIGSNYWQQNNFILKDFRVRKLTPKECFRLMGFLDDQINLEGLSNTQRYKLAGNGWDVNLVSKIFKQMFKHSLSQKSSREVLKRKELLFKQETNDEN